MGLLGASKNVHSFRYTCSHGMEATARDVLVVVVALREGK